MKIGFIQTSAIGDILIALPAAKWYVDRGFDVYWPIDSRFYEFYKKSAPYINFLSVDHNSIPIDYWLEKPKSLLKNNHIKDVFILYHYLGTNQGRYDFGQPMHLVESLKFDEYKYAICSAPFEQKWNLDIERDLNAENLILEKISAHVPFKIAHEAPAGKRRNIVDEIEELHDIRTIHPTSLTNNPLDWLSAFEMSQIILCEDSVFANLTEQRNLTQKKYLFLRSPIQNTPVFKNGWIFK